MKVYTYFEKIPGINAGEQAEQLAVWSNSWRMAGWSPVVLSDEIARILYVEMSRLQSLPSINPKGYDLACMKRWFALRAIGGGLMTDYDVVNLGFTPSMLPSTQAGLPMCLCNYWVPAVVFTYPAGCVKLCQTLVDYVPQIGENHVSDMTIFQKVNPGTYWRLARDSSEPDLGERLVHCSTHGLISRGITTLKSQIMEQLWRSSHE